MLGKLTNDIYLLCVHFGLFKREKLHQLDLMLSMLKDDVPNDMPLIIAGDFNDWNLSIDKKLRKEANLKEVYSEIYGRPARTFPSALPILPMDRIYYRNLELEDVEVLSGMPWNKLSDHCAINAIFSVVTD